MELVNLAQNYFGNTRSGSLVGPIGAFVIAALAVTTILLIRNMNARIRRLPDHFPDPDDGGQAPPPAAGSESRERSLPREQAESRASGGERRL